MVDISFPGANIRAEDAGNNVVEISTVGWESDSSSDPLLPYPMDDVLTGRAKQLTLSHLGHAEIVALDEDGEMVNHDIISAENTSRELVDQHNLLRIDSHLHVLIQFDSRAVVSQQAENQIVVNFEHPTPVTIAFLSLLKHPRHTVTVPRTSSGIATALTYASSAIIQDTCARAAPTNRGHPPKIEFSDEIDIPADLRRNFVTSNLELKLPDNLKALFPAAPLAFYLGAAVTVERRRQPKVQSTTTEFEHQFSSLPAFQFEAARLLRRIFYLDNLVRFEQTFAIDSPDLDVLSLAKFTPEAYADAPLEDRLETALAVDYDRIEPMLPPWHSLVYIEPSYEHATILPYLLSNLSQVFLPSAQSASDTGRIPPGGGTDGHSEPLSVQDPAGPYVGWLGQSAPSGMYEATPQAYRHRDSYLGDETKSADVTLLCTDANRRAELSEILSIYRGKSPLPIEVDVLTDASRAEILAAFETEVDLLHVVGDCSDGIDCEDGTVRPSDISTSNVRLFYLDGPASKRTGREILDRGSVAGIVPTKSTTDTPRPVSVHRDLLRLITAGMPLAQAARYVEWYNTDGQVSILGDGTALLSHPEEYYLAPTHIKPIGQQQFRVTIETMLPENGYMYSIPIDPHHQLSGNAFELTLSASDLQTLLNDMETILRYNGEFYQNEELGLFSELV